MGGVMLRKAAFAGSFYDANPQSLKIQMNNWFDEIDLPDVSDKLLGVICPHAGYVYSGSCAAYSYKVLDRSKIKTAIIIHPSHKGNHFGFSIPNYDEYETPLGNLKADKLLAEKLMKHSDEIDDYYHQNEHSMEVQLPFLFHINPDINIVPILIGRQDYDVSKDLAKLLIKQVDFNSTAIIVSTDLSHYLGSEVANAMDGRLIDYITTTDTELFYDNIIHHRIEACGFCGILTLMHMTKYLNDSYIKKLHYTHSGYTSGDFDQVVGYLSAALLQKEK